MDFKFDNKNGEWLNYIVEDLFSVMENNSISNNVSLAGWHYEDLAICSSYVNGMDGNIDELAQIIISKVEEIEEKIGTDATIEVFRNANNNILKDNELKDLFDKIDSLTDEYEPLQEVKRKNKIKP